jgi:YfiH family protein
VQVAARQALVCRLLEPHATHLFSTREWALGSRRNSTAAAEDKADGSGDLAWEEVASAVRVEPAHLIRAKQVHGVAMIVKQKGSAELPPLTPADILMTDDGDVGLAIQTADCVPLLMADHRTGVVAAAHAGWRGLVAGVPAATVDALAAKFGSCAADLVVAIGPSIGACCYQVGPDVRAAFKTARFSDAQVDRWLLSGPRSTDVNPSMPGVDLTPNPARWYLDLWQVARDQLELAGVPRNQIQVAELCTASHPDWFCSHRRDGSPAGRLVASIKSIRRD